MLWDNSNDLIVLSFSTWEYSLALLHFSYLHNQHVAKSQNEALQNYLFKEVKVMWDLVL